MKDWIHRHENNYIKGSMYLGFGLIAALPLFHLAINEMFFHSSNKYSSLNAFWYYIFMGISYILGLYIYLIKFPEKARPGKFDIWVIK